MHWFVWTILACVAWALWVVCAHALCAGPREDPWTGLAWRAARVYAFLVHRLRVEGGEHIVQMRDAGPLVLVINHTAGVDPVLVQSVCPFFVRWMMGRDMRAGSLSHIWEWLDIIDVDRKGRDTTAARHAIRALRAGGVIGIFPEGRIERPRGTLLPFHAGVGMIVAAGKAPAQPIYVRGTPDARTAWGSLWRRGNAVVRFGPVMDVAGCSAEEITARLRGWFERQMGPAR